MSSSLSALLLWALPLALGTLSLGCAGASSGAPPKAAAGEEPSLTTATIVVSSTEAVDVEFLLRRGQERLEAKDFSAAAEDFEKVATLAEDPEFRRRGLLGWGTARDLGGDAKGALQLYLRYVSEAPDGARKSSIEVRVVRLLVYLEQYEEAGARAQALSTRDLSSLQQLAVFGARALSGLAHERLAEAERDLARGRSIVDAQSLDRVAVPPLDVAALFFGLGELHRMRAEKVTFSPVPPDFSRKLEERCQLILDAQAAYSTTMRSEDAHWSSMSGVRVGQLYKDLHQDLMAMPTPQAADTEKRRQLFEGALRLRYSILLRKSLAMMRSTVKLLDRTEDRSPWRKKAIDALTEIEEAEAAEEAAIDALPYSREQLKQALDDLAERAKAQSGPSAGS